MGSPRPAGRAAGAAPGGDAGAPHAALQVLWPVPPAVREAACAVTHCEALRALRTDLSRARSAPSLGPGPGAVTANPAGRPLAPRSRQGGGAPGREPMVLPAPKPLPW